jgi:nucleoside-diphosphate-sugar epimerase
MKMLVTGANGFVGRALCPQLVQYGEVLAAVRSPIVNSMVPQIAIHAIDEKTGWMQALGGIDVVIHLAARVHVMKDRSAEPLAEYRKTNVAGTLNLARQAGLAGVKRFIFISSIKVNGEESPSGQPFTEQSLPAPLDFYGATKNEAEIGLRRLAEATGLEVVIIRPPLVYGPGVGANFGSLVSAVKRGFPLPLASINNRRSLISCDNLVNFIYRCAVCPEAAGRTFLISDGQDLSTPELIRRIACAAGVQPRLFKLPTRLLLMGAGLLGKRAALQRLCGNLQIDSSLARDLLCWTPPVTVDEGLRRTLASFQLQ